MQSRNRDKERTEFWVIIIDAFYCGLVFAILGFMWWLGSFING